MAKNWTTKEYRYLIDNWKLKGKEGCAAALGRTPSGVAYMASKLGITCRRVECNVDKVFGNRRVYRMDREKNIEIMQSQQLRKQTFGIRSSYYAAEMA